MKDSIESLGKLYEKQQETIAKQLETKILMETELSEIKDKF
jgi:hypothetical protein